MRGRIIRAAAILAAVGIVGCGGASSNRHVDVGGARLVFRVMPVVSGAPVGASVDQAVAIFRRRLAFLGSEAAVSVVGGRVVVTLSNRAVISRVVNLSATGQFAFYDWEGDVLLPSGKPVASAIAGGDPAALRLIQGVNGVEPGAPGAGSMSLFDAAKLAAAQPEHTGSSGPQEQAEYFLFGSAGSDGCPSAVALSGGHCLLAGPAASSSELAGELPSGVTLSDGHELVVKPGTLLVQAMPPTATFTTAFTDPAAQFFVLRGRPALTGAEVTDPRAHSGSPLGVYVGFSFTPSGVLGFEALTRAVALRGVGAPVVQHFAVVIDHRLMTVAGVDSAQYPAGLPGNHGASITGSFTSDSADDFATILRTGPLPVTLQLVSSASP